jgi:hypothetical protein
MVGNENYLQQYINFWNSYLTNRWPDQRFKVEMMKDYMTFNCITKIGFVLPNGTAMYVTQVDHEVNIDHLRYKVQDTTIATIMLLIGE